MVIKNELREKRFRRHICQFWCSADIIASLKVKTQRIVVMRTFVMGDIHGAYKALIQCLERSSFNYENDRLIQLGDIVDGYPEVYECIEELLKLKKLIAIKGNHDDWFDAFIKSNSIPIIGIKEGSPH